MSKLKDKDFRWVIDYDYDTRYSCQESGCDMICRCGTIHSEVITKIDVDAIVGEIYSEYFDNSLSTIRNNTINNILNGITKEIDIYTIDRIIRYHKVFDSNVWEINITGGYYGEEIDTITLDTHVALQIEQDIDIALSIDDLSGRIEYLVGLEYGHLLPELEGCSYDIIEVNKKDIIFGSDGHYQKIKEKKLDHYLDSNYSGIRGIVIKKERKISDQWRLIDGYHRCTSTKKDKVKVLRAFK
jgi:hypothetical protein